MRAHYCAGLGSVADAARRMILHWPSGGGLVEILLPLERRIHVRWPSLPPGYPEPGEKDFWAFSFEDDGKARAGVAFVHAPLQGPLCRRIIPAAAMTGWHRFFEDLGYEIPRSHWAVIPLPEDVLRWAEMIREEAREKTLGPRGIDNLPEALRLARTFPEPPPVPDPGFPPPPVPEWRESEETPEASETNG